MSQRLENSEGLSAASFESASLVEMTQLDIRF